MQITFWWCHQISLSSATYVIYDAGKKITVEFQLITKTFNLLFFTDGYFQLNISTHYYTHAYKFIYIYIIYE